MQFPMIGEPGAEKILMFSGVLGVLALESNGLRALVRLGFGEDRKSYSATYKSVREVTLEELPADCKPVDEGPPAVAAAWPAVVPPERTGMPRLPGELRLPVLSGPGVRLAGWVVGRVIASDRRNVDLFGPTLETRRRLRTESLRISGTRVPELRDRVPRKRGAIGPPRVLRARRLPRSTANLSRCSQPLLRDRMTRPRSRLCAEPFLHSAVHLLLGNDPAFFDVFEPAFDLLPHVDVILDVFEGSVVGDPV